MGRAILSQPLVLAIILGVTVNLSGLPLPVAVGAAVDMIARASLPTALFGLGGVLLRYRPDGDKALVGEPNPKQWEMYAKNNCVFQYHMPETSNYMRNWNRAYLDFAKDKGWRQRNDPVQLVLYSDTLQSFRLAAQAVGMRRQRAAVHQRNHDHAVLGDHVIELFRNGLTFGQVRCLGQLGVQLIIGRVTEPVDVLALPLGFR